MPPVRAVTRNPGSDAARALADRGAEVVKADLDQIDTLKAAFAGCHGAYCVTNYWEHFSPEKETQQAKNLAEAAAAAGVDHVIWSTLEDTREGIPLDDDRMPTLIERYKVPHFDAKGQADRFFEDVPTTYLLTTAYWDNFIHFGWEPQRGEDGSLSLVLPMGDRPLPGLAVEDIGRCALGIFREGASTIGERIGIAAEHLTGAQMAKALGAVLGEPVTHVSPPFDVYRGFGFPGADDVGNMFQFYHDFNDVFTASRSVERARALNPQLQDFQTWLSRNGDRIPRH